LKRIINDIKKYRGYILYSAKSELNNEVASSYLNWIWWILNPVFLMLIYTFLVKVVFKTHEPYFAVFVFTGITIWTVYNKVLKSSVKLIKSNKSIVTKIYLPKYILIIVKLFVNLFKMSISFIIIFVMMFFYKVPVTLNILYIIPLIMLLSVLSFGFASILAHFGTFIEDLANVIDVFFKFLFYISGVFFSISTRVPAPYGDILLRFNPIAYIIDEFRNVMLFGQHLNFTLYFIWLAAGLVVSYTGIKLIYKYENSYAKVL